MSLVTTVYAVASSSLAIGVVAGVSGYVPPEPGIAVACLVAQAITTLTLALALGTRLPSMTAGAIAVVAFGAAWLGGFLGSVAGLLRAEALVPTLDAVRFLFPTDLLWRVVIHGLEPPIVSLMARGLSTSQFTYDPFFALEPVSLGNAAWALVSGACSCSGAGSGPSADGSSDADPGSLWRGGRDSTRRPRDSV